MNAIYIANNLLKNFIMFFLKNLLTQRGNLGLDGDPSLVQETLMRMGRMTEKMPVNVVNKLVYELGPGRTPYLMMAFGLAGAQRVVGLDVHNWMNDDWDFNKGFADLLSEIKKDKGASFIKGFCMDSNAIRTSLDNLSNSNPIQYSIYSGDSINEKDNSVSFLYSKSVLEHIKHKKIEKSLTEQYRILEKGGYALHIVDLRDHLHINGDHEVIGDWLDALRYPEWLHNALTSNRRAYINRLRVNAWKKIFVESGFEIISLNKRHEELSPAFSKEKLSSPFRYSEEDFSVSWIDVLLRK